MRILEVCGASFSARLTRSSVNAKMQLLPFSQCSKRSLNYLLMNIILYVYLSELGGHGGHNLYTGSRAGRVWKVNTADAGPGAAASRNCQNTAIVWIIAKAAPPRTCQEEKLKEERDGTRWNVHAKTFLKEAEKGQMGWEGKKRKEDWDGEGGYQCCLGRRLDSQREVISGSVC